MVTLFVAVLMEKTLLSSLLLTRAATAWIRTGRRQAVMVLKSRGVLRLRLQLLPRPATLRVGMLCLPALERISTSSHRSSGHARRPCRTGGSGIIFAGSSGGVCSSRSRKDLGTRLRFLELEKKLVEHWLCSANKLSFTFCYVIDIMSWLLRLLPLSMMMLVVVVANHPSMGTHVKVVIPWVMYSCRLLVSL